MSDNFSVDSLSGLKDDQELQEFLMVEKQKATINAQIHDFTDQCWDKCMDKIGSKMDYKTESCLTNCVERFIDVSQLITGRFAKMLQSSANGLQ